MRIKYVDILKGLAEGVSTEEILADDVNPSHFQKGKITLSKFEPTESKNLDHHRHGPGRNLRRLVSGRRTSYSG